MTPNAKLNAMTKALLRGCAVQPSLPKLAHSRTKFDQFRSRLQYFQGIIGHDFLRVPSGASPA